jgi:hypothetical protein
MDVRSKSIAWHYLGHQVRATVIVSLLFVWENTEMNQPFQLTTSGVKRVTVISAGRANRAIFDET